MRLIKAKIQKVESRSSQDYNIEKGENEILNLRTFSPILL